ncbi:MAG TPA: helicase-related protein [Polyangiaceae bacterium]|nr:helicase-related protein [Polyangiaceae bacterium]
MRPDGTGRTKRPRRCRHHGGLGAILAPPQGTVRSDFRALGIRAEKIDGKTKDRQRLLEQFQAGGLQVLANYGVLTEGFDDPGVACILMARPTTSPLVYTQCIGRGLRCAPGKNDCAIIDLVDRGTHQLQYAAVQMAGLPRHWRSRGGDPFRQARSLQGIKVTTPEAFLRVRQSSSLEEVHAILMSLPPSVVVAGLDGEPVLRYTPTEQRGSLRTTEAEVSRLLQQAGVVGARVLVSDESVRVTFRNPEVDNERYAYLKWHLAQVTRRAVEYDAIGAKGKRPNPRALLRSMLPERCRLDAFEAASSGEVVVATVTGLAPHEIADFASAFRDECGVQLELKGQMSLF